MSKLNDRLTLVANLSVVVGIVFLAMEMRQNTQAIRAQTRDAMTEKQMLMSDWVTTTPELAGVIFDAQVLGRDQLTGPEQVAWRLFVAGNLREWENSHYQFERGLYTEDEFAPRRARWRQALRSPAFREDWAFLRDQYAPDFRAEVDRMVAEIEAEP